MTVLEIVALTLAAIVATAIVFTDEPVRQSMVAAIYGLVLSCLFFILQAPDVALSMIVVSGIAVPVMVLLALARMRDVVPQDDDAEADG